MQLDQLIDELGDVGQRLWQIGAAEGAAGNLSIWLRTLDQIDPRWSARHVIELPVAAPALAGGWLIVTGSARRLRDIARSPDATLCVLHIHDGGTRAALHSAVDLKPTSELNSHLLIHADQIARHAWDQHAVAHAQPLRLTYLSHLDRYGDTRSFNRRLLRWQPETIMEFPEGLGVLPFAVPGSVEQAAQTATALHTHRAIVWRKHGIITRATTIGKAADLIEYAEAAARYEYLHLAAGEPQAGLTDAELRSTAECLGIDQTMF